jgi:ABC-type polysaccharide/polyol phosphate export permease
MRPEGAGGAALILLPVTLERRRVHVEAFATLRDLWRYRSLIANLVLKDLRLKYRNSVLGVCWSLLNPLLLMGVYTVAFKHIMRVPTESYPFFLVVGLLPWTFFSTAVVGSTGAVTGNAHLIRKVAFPSEALPVAGVLFAFTQLLLALAVFIPAVALLSGARFAAVALLFPVLLGLHLLMTVGVAFALSALTTSFRDVAHLTEVALLLVFWLTPVMYPASMAPAPLQYLFLFSPPAAFALAYQDLLFWGRLPAPPVAAAVLLFPVLALAIGHRIFRAYRTTFAEDV